MATRLYYGRQAPTASFSPAVDSSWDITHPAGPLRRQLNLTKYVPVDIFAQEDITSTTTSNTPAGAVDVHAVQYISAPLSGSQTISGNIKSIIRVHENNAAANAHAQMVIRVIQSDGSTVRGTLIASTAAALASEFGTVTSTGNSRKFPLAWTGTGATPTSVNAQDGDRIVVEIGWRKHESAVTSRSAVFRMGNPSGTDAAEDETGTSGVAWIEFADTLVFQTTPERVSQTAAQVALEPVPAVRVSQTYIHAAFFATIPPQTRFSHTVVNVALIPDAALTAIRVSQTYVTAAVVPRVLTFLLDALIQQTAEDALFSVNATITRTQATSFAVDAAYGRGFTLGATILREATPGLFTLEATLAQQKDFEVDAIIGPGGLIALNAILRKSVSTSFLVDAWMTDGTKVFTNKTIDAIIRRSIGLGFFLDAEASLAGSGIRTGSAPVDALCLERFIEDFTLDAVIESGHRERSFTVNADLKGQNEKRGTFSLDALVSQRVIRLVVVEAYIGGKGYFRADAQLFAPKTFTVDAEKAARRFVVDAEVCGGVFIDAEISLPFFTVDAEINRLSFKLDAVILRPASYYGCWVDPFERTVANGFGGPWTTLETKLRNGTDYSPAQTSVDGHRATMPGVKRSSDPATEQFYNIQYETYGGFPFLWSGTAQFDFLAGNANYSPSEAYTLTVGSDQFSLSPDYVATSSSAYWHIHSKVWDLFSPEFLLANNTWYTLKLEFNGYAWTNVPYWDGFSWQDHYEWAGAPDRFKVWTVGSSEPAGWTEFGDKEDAVAPVTSWAAMGIAYRAELKLKARWWIAWSGSTILAEGSQPVGVDNFSMCSPFSLGFTADAQLVSTTGTRGATFTVDAYVGGFTSSFTLFTLDAFIKTVRSGSFTVNAQFGPGFTIDAFIRPSFTLNAHIRGNATIVYPDDGGPPLDPEGNPWPDWFKASRKYRIKITVAGVDITGDVNFSRSTFTQNAKTGAGTFELVLYGAQAYDGGEEVLVEIDDFRTFGGYVMTVERGYVFSAEATWTVTILGGTDFNVLFDRLFVYNKAVMTGTTGKYTNWRSFKKGTYDDTIIRKVFGSYVDLPPGFDYTTYVDRVDVAAIEEPWTMPTAGSSLRQVMQSLSQATESVWWIDPYLNLHNHARSTITAPYPVTDGRGGISSRVLSVSADLSQMVNGTIVWGTLARTIEGEIAAIIDADIPSLVAYGRWQYGEFRSDLHHTNYLTRRAQSILDRYSRPIYRAKATIFEPGYQAGQGVQVISSEHGIDKVLVIRSMTLTMAVAKERDGDTYYGVPRYALDIGLDPESPWDIYDFLPFPDSDTPNYQPWRRDTSVPVEPPVYDASRDLHYYSGTFTFLSDTGGSAHGPGYGGTIYADANRDLVDFAPVVTGTTWLYSMGMMKTAGQGSGGAPDGDYHPEMGVGTVPPNPPIRGVSNWNNAALHLQPSGGLEVIGQLGSFHVDKPHSPGLYAAVAQCAAGDHVKKTVNVIFWFDPVNWSGWAPPAPPLPGQPVRDTPFPDPEDQDALTYYTNLPYAPGSLRVFDHNGDPILAFTELDPATGKFALAVATDRHSISVTYDYPGVYVDTDIEGEFYGVVGAGWGCETINVVDGQIETTGLVSSGTLNMYNADPGDEHEGELMTSGWVSQGDGKHFTITSGAAHVVACYRNYVVNAQSTVTPRIVTPNKPRTSRHIPL